MRAMLIFHAALTTALIAGPPASAGWGETEWGMTDSQVLAAHPDAAAAYSPGASSYLRVDGPVTFGGASWKHVYFLFDTKGRLRSVRLSGEAPFEQLRDRLAAQLGPPVVLEEGRQGLPGLRSYKAIYRDPAKRNTITLETIRTDLLPQTTNLTYDPAAADF